MKQRCNVCETWKPLADFPPHFRRRNGHARRCLSCGAEGVPTAESPPPTCTTCGCRVVTPGECGFCWEQRTGQSLTLERLVPKLAAEGASAHRLFAARLVAEQPTNLEGMATVSTSARCPQGHLKEGYNLTPGGKCRTCEVDRKRAVRESAGADVGSAPRQFVAA